MKNKYILLFLFGFFGIHASAQTLAQAKYSMKKDNTNRQSPFLRNL